MHSRHVRRLGRSRTQGVLNGKHKLGPTRARHTTPSHVSIRVTVSPTPPSLGAAHLNIHPIPLTPLTHGLIAPPRAAHVSDSIPVLIPVPVSPSPTTSAASHGPAACTPHLHHTPTPNAHSSTRVEDELSTTCRSTPSPLLPHTSRIAHHVPRTTVSLPLPGTSAARHCVVVTAPSGPPVVLSLTPRPPQAAALPLAVLLHLGGDALPQDLPGEHRYLALPLLAHAFHARRRGRVLLAPDLVRLLLAPPFPIPYKPPRLLGTSWSAVVRWRITGHTLKSQPPGGGLGVKKHLCPVALRSPVKVVEVPSCLRRHLGTPKYGAEGCSSHCPCSLTDPPIATC